MAARVGLFGGTFDPVHLGHLAIAESFLESGRIDELWILPAPSPPHKQEDTVTAFRHRRKMLELAFADYERVRVDDIEQQLESPSYTVRTVRHLVRKYPDHTFYLCLGEDSLADFSDWYKPDEIVAHCGLLVAERPGSSASVLPERYREKARYVEHEPVELSSSKIRSRLRKGEEYGILEGLVPPAVIEYIRKQNLYRYN